MKGLTLAEESSQLGIPKATISNWERGLSSPSLDTLCKLASFYGCTIDYLLSYDPEPEVAELVTKLKALPKEQQDSVLTIVNNLKAAKG